MSKFETDKASNGAKGGGQCPFKEKIDELQTAIEGLLRENKRLLAANLDLTARLRMVESTVQEFESQP